MTITEFEDKFASFDDLEEPITFSKTSVLELACALGEWAEAVNTTMAVMAERRSPGNPDEMFKADVDQLAWTGLDIGYTKASSTTTNGIEYEIIDTVSFNDYGITMSVEDIMTYRSLKSTTEENEEDADTSV